jgi:hypothetical protein
MSGMLSSAWDGLSSAMGALGGGAGGGSGDMLDTIMSFFADGGHVSGPGNGTSDSIPAMLSNGEFIINAEATKKHRGLLESINFGTPLKKFATGGLAGDSIMSVPMSLPKGAVSTSKRSSSSTFNINITGDVSRQTRSEIQAMIPQIATGVNMHNYEQGRR